MTSHILGNECHMPPPAGGALRAPTCSSGTVSDRSVDAANGELRQAVMMLSVAGG